MCGIVGKVNFNNKNLNTEEIDLMLDAIKHRGPDGKGIYLNANIGLGHSLLKIQDLTQYSKQPFKYKNYVMTYNGEIYNFMELKKELISNGYEFNTSGDTEVLIKYIDYAGIDKALEQFEGCFAIGLYDKNSEDFYLIRDRFGIKPLYYYINSDKLVFGSEIKSILTDESVKRVFNLDAITIALNCKLWMDPTITLFKDIYMLDPGCYLKIDKNYNITKKQYYRLVFDYKYDNAEEVIEKFGEELISSVRKKAISKVPIAAFLSGGLDSSIICKYLNKYVDNLNTYTIKYDYDNDLDVNHATLLSKEENICQHDILISEDMYNIENIDKVTYFVEEILIDKVYIPMYYNYKAAKNDGYTVVISGQGSDEPWLGYIFVWKIFKYLNKDITNQQLINQYYKGEAIFKGKLTKSFEENVNDILANYLDKNLNLDEEDIMNSYSDFSVKTILHDLLVQEDKIAMANSVESRVPFVDNHRIVELAYNTTSKLKLYDKREKYIVRKFSEGKINDKIVNREKYPFPEPPKIYNEKIKSICEENWNKIKKSAVLNKIIDFRYNDTVEKFNGVEQWWLLVIWRFEEVFEMEI